MADDINPKVPSSDYTAMTAYWQMVDAILGGAQALRNHAGMYLPRFENETQKDYANRVAWSPLTNIYADISRNLASKPFSKQLVVGDDASDAIQGQLDTASNKRTGGFVDDVDGRGNNLHVFASEAFKRAIDDGLTWIMADYTAAGDDADGAPSPVRSKAQEDAMGLRPFWLNIPAAKVLAAYSEFENGVEVLVHVRIDESTTERSGFGEKAFERVRVIDREEIGDGTYGAPIWTVYEKQRGDGVAEVWNSIDTGTYTIGVIPMVCVFIGERIGSTFAVEPPLRDLAYMQIEEFQQESNLKTVKNLTAFPMLVGEGVGDPGNDEVTGQKIVIPVGPRAVLLAPPNSSGSNGTFKFIEPSATSLNFLETSLSTFRKEMRDLGMQPLTEANLTVITTANVSRKASSAVQAWAILFQDALERCFSLTSLWLKEPDTTTVIIHTDFSVDMDDGNQTETLLKAVGQAVLSKRTARAEFKRRGMLSDEFNEDDEEQRIAEEMGGLEPEIAIDPITGEEVQPSAGRPLVLQKPNPVTALPAAEKNAINATSA